MGYELFIGDRTYSSWSLRGWLLFEKFGIPHKLTLVDLYAGNLQQQLAALPLARTVPALRLPGGAVVGDSLAMAETLAERHPEAGIWPAGADDRARARWMAAEMHSGFTALRGGCPMQLVGQYRGFEPAPAVLADLARIETIWSATGRQAGGWLFGAYSATDAFFAPVAARIAGYDLPVSDTAADYVALHLADPAFRRWRALGLTRHHDPEPYASPLQRARWPGPAPLAASAVDEGPARNAACPYSGKPVTHFMQAGGQVWGFCNETCRDKTVNDAEAWPAFMNIYQS